MADISITGKSGDASLSVKASAWTSVKLSNIIVNNDIYSYSTTFVMHCTTASENF